jgi:hypothetical protein
VANFLRLKQERFEFPARLNETTRAVINCRLLPDECSAEVRQALIRVLTSAR